MGATMLFQHLSMEPKFKSMQHNFGASGQIMNSKQNKIELNGIKKLSRGTNHDYERNKHLDRVGQKLN